MTIWRKRVLFGVSAAAILIGFAPFRDEARREAEALKRAVQNELALRRMAEQRQAAPRPAPMPEPNFADLPVAAPDVATLVQREIDAEPTGSLRPSPPGVPATVAVEPQPAPGSDARGAGQGMPAPQARGVSPAAVAYRAADSATLSALAKAAGEPDERLALEWAALRVNPAPSRAEIITFSAAHPNWPGAGWLRYREEAELAIHPIAPKAALAYFAAAPPLSSAGKLALARATLGEGQVADAIALIRALWRDGNFDSWTESRILQEFGASLQSADHKRRADRLLYTEAYGPAMRAAILAGADEAALAQARAAAARGPLGPALVKAVPPALRRDPGLLFARIQDARRSGRVKEAATLLDLAPKDRATLINPDKWWLERRMVARRLLDIDEPQLAFRICADAVPPELAAARVDANFHAGWIALRFLDEPDEAARRFALAAESADTPLSIARAAYWRGRAAEAKGDSLTAKAFYQDAASRPFAYYGQLAAAKLGAKRIDLRQPKAVAEGDQRDEAVRVVEQLYADQLDDLASGLAFDAARTWGDKIPSGKASADETQLAAMADVVARHADAAMEVQFGKIAILRGLPFETMAFPSTGVPAFLPLAKSADIASVYAVARQESEFLWRASSGAGAKGLMQLLPSTAASTARRAGVAYDYERLLADPAFNTQLGAAFLGQVMGDLDGPPELAFAAYNAGPARVAQWLAAYGDPRAGKTDLVDWIERIPYDETRDYVQRVSENLGVYRQLFADTPPAQGPMPARLARE